MEVKSDYSKESGIYFEQSIDIGNYSYLVVFGYHINGGYICIPNWNIGCELADSIGEQLYNVGKLTGAGLDKEVAKQICEYINMWLSENHEKVCDIKEKQRAAMNKRLEKFGSKIHTIEIEC
ncbi:MAG: hypothetical protein K6G88_08300 [Lachnospiraceae bacterium]|nr:hypothetical protein [Lachnospiraceae bacterium]